jgi:hypothetical protein
MIDAFWFLQSSTSDVIGAKVTDFILYAFDVIGAKNNT